MAEDPNIAALNAMSNWQISQNQSQAAVQAAALQANASQQNAALSAGAAITTKSMEIEAAKQSLAEQLAAQMAIAQMQQQTQNQQIAAMLLQAQQKIQHEAWALTEQIKQQQAQFQAEFGLSVEQFNLQKQMAEAGAFAQPNDWVKQAYYLGGQQAPQGGAMNSAPLPSGYKPYSPPPVAAPPQMSTALPGLGGGDGQQPVRMPGLGGAGASGLGNASQSLIQNAAQYGYNGLPMPTFMGPSAGRNNVGTSGPIVPPVVGGAADGAFAQFAAGFAGGGSTPQRGQIERTTNGRYMVWNGNEWVTVMTLREATDLSNSLQANAGGMGTAGTSAQGDRPPGATGPVSGPTSEMGTAGFSAQGDRPGSGPVSGPPPSRAPQVPAPGQPTPGSNATSVAGAIAAGQNQDYLDEQTTATAPAPAAAKPPVLPAGGRLITPTTANINGQYFTWDGVQGAWMPMPNFAANNNVQPQAPAPMPEGMFPWLGANGAPVPNMAGRKNPDGSVSIFTNNAQTGQWEQTGQAGADVPWAGGQHVNPNVPQAPAPGATPTPGQQQPQGDAWSQFVASMNPSQQKVWAYSHGQADDLQGVDPSQLGSLGPAYQHATAPQTNAQMPAAAGAAPTSAAASGPQVTPERKDIGAGFDPRAVPGMGNPQDTAAIQQQVMRDYNVPGWAEEMKKRMQASFGISPGMAYGGMSAVQGYGHGGPPIVEPGQKIVVGERGPEIVELPPGARVIPLDGGQGGPTPMYRISPANERGAELVDHGTMAPFTLDTPGAMGGAMTPFSGRGIGGYVPMPMLPGPQQPPQMAPRVPVGQPRKPPVFNRPYPVPPVKVTPGPSPRVGIDPYRPLPAQPTPTANPMSRVTPGMSNGGYSYGTEYGTNQGAGGYGASVNFNPTPPPTPAAPAAPDPNLAALQQQLTAQQQQNQQSSQQLAQALQSLNQSSTALTQQQTQQQGQQPGQQAQPQQPAPPPASGAVRNPDGTISQTPATQTAQNFGYTPEQLAGMPWLQRLSSGGAPGAAFSTYSGPLSPSQLPGGEQAFGPNFPSLPAPHQINPQTWMRMKPTEQQMALGLYRSLGFLPEDVQQQINAAMPGTLGMAPWLNVGMTRWR